MHTMTLTLIVQWIFFRLSLAFQFLRLIPERWERLVVYLATFIAVAIGTVHFFFNLFICGGPTHYAAVLFNEPQKCYSSTVDEILLYTMISIGVVFDFVVVGLPMRQVLNSRTMTTRSKLTVSIVLFLFIGGTIASIIRLATLKHQYDMTIIQKGTIGSLVGIIEPALFVIGGCLGTLRPMVRKAREVTQKSSRNTDMASASTAITKNTLDSPWSESAEIPTLKNFSKFT
jgi:hypothetical protein